MEAAGEEGATTALNSDMCSRVYRPAGRPPECRYARRRDDGRQVLADTEPLLASLRVLDLCGPEGDLISRLLADLGADVIKIDRTFVRDMLDDVNDLAIVEGIIALSRAFHRQVVAEGVESSAHYQRLLELGCAVGQGYCIARPMPVEDVVSWMSNWRPDRMDNLLHREELEA